MYTRDFPHPYNGKNLAASIACPVVYRHAMWCFLPDWSIDIFICLHIQSMILSVSIIYIYIYLPPLFYFNVPPPPYRLFISSVYTYPWPLHPICVIYITYMYSLYHVTFTPYLLFALQHRYKLPISIYTQNFGMTFRIWFDWERGRANASPRCHKLWRALSHIGEMLGQTAPPAVQWRRRP